LSQFHEKDVTKSETEKGDKSIETSMSAIISDKSTKNIHTNNLHNDNTEIEQVDNKYVGATYDFDLVINDSIVNPTSEVVQTIHTEADVECTENFFSFNPNKIHPKKPLFQPLIRILHKN